MSLDHSDTWSIFRLAGCTGYPCPWMQAGPALLLIAGALLVVFLAENARIPVDDPNTHLELTMIHEVMVLDHSGPDFAFILYGAALKLWMLGALLVGRSRAGAASGQPLVDAAAAIGGMFVAGRGDRYHRVFHGPAAAAASSSTADRGAGALAVLALMLVLRR